MKYFLLICFSFANVPMLAMESGVDATQFEWSDYQLPHSSDPTIAFECPFCLPSHSAHVRTEPFRTRVPETIFNHLVELHHRQFEGRSLKDANADPLIAIEEAIVLGIRAWIWERAERSRIAELKARIDEELLFRERAAAERGDVHEGEPVLVPAPWDRRVLEPQPKIVVRKPRQQISQQLPKAALRSIAPRQEECVPPSGMKAQHSSLTLPLLHSSFKRPCPAGKTTEAPSSKRQRLEKQTHIETRNPTSEIEEEENE